MLHYVGVHDRLLPACVVCTLQSANPYIVKLSILDDELALNVSVQYNNDLGVHVIPLSWCMENF